MEEVEEEVEVVVVAGADMVEEEVVVAVATITGMGVEEAGEEETVGECH